MLKPAKNIQSYAKVGLFGQAGSGKSRTAVEIATGLHARIESINPIAVFDTEPAFSWLLPIFEERQIEILIEDQTRALIDLMAFMDEAEKVSDIVIIDSITHVWRDAQDSFLKRVNASRRKNNRPPLKSLEFQHWRPIKAAWADFTDRFMSSKLHVIVCGRAGSIYEYQEKDDGSGKRELISTGQRMATEKELGYEPSLLVEMIADRRNGKTINTAMIQKDRSDNINGWEIQMPKYQDFSKHFEALNFGGKHFESMDSKDSQEMFKDADESGFDGELKQRAIYSEEIAELLKKHHPAQSVIDKQARADLLEEIFSTRSWTAVEGMRSSTLKDKLLELRLKLEPPEEAEQDINQ